MIRIILVIFTILMLAVTLSFFSGLIVVGHDFSQNATIGEIHFHGCPVWFKETAPGYSVVDGWHFDRFLYNTSFWVGSLVASLLVFYLRWKRRVQ